MMYAEEHLAPTDLREGTRVEVATRFTGSWTHGFEVSALHRDGCQVRRISDGAVLPVDFDYSDVRALEGSRPPVAELIARFERATGEWEMAAIADELGETGDHSAVGPILARLGDRNVQAQPELAHTLCHALVALGVMCTCGEGNFALQPRHSLAPDVVDVITEMGPAFPMRYLIARQA